jgi:predicted alpha/beta-fold hydrolase
MKMRGRQLRKGLCMGAMAVGVLGTTLPIAAQERENAAAMDSFQIPSHGSPMNAFVYIAAGAGPHPVVVLLHGFPGNEKNLDLAQDIRRAGWDVL